MDYRVAEPSRLIVTARREVRGTLRTDGDETYYFLEDTVRGRYFRLGLPEYALLQSLDGTRNLADAAEQTAATLGPDAFTVDQVVSLAKWLVDAGLATTTAGSAPVRVAEAERRRDEERRRRWNPWFLRFTCDNLDAWLTRLAPIGNLLFRREVLAVWCVVVLWAVVLAVTHGSEMLAATPIELGPRGAAQLLVAWCLLKLVHETAHGLAARRFGGSVGSWGIALVMGMPSPYVEVSSVWRLPEKWHRIIVSLAGIYVELLVAAGAVFVWVSSDDGIVRQTALAVATVAGAATLLFNLNPLMRFDGYFALSDWLERPNLASSAQEAVRRFMRRYFLGLDEKSVVATKDQSLWLTVYGLAAIAWRWMVFVGLMLLCLNRFGGPATLLLSLLPVTYTLSRGWRFLHRRRTSPPGVTVNRRRLAWTYGLAAVGACLWMALFDPRRIELPAVVEYEPLTVVRVATPGFVEDLLVGDGDQVVAGQVIARLKNDDLETDWVQAKNLVEQSLAKSRVHRQAGEVAKEQGEAARRRGLESKLQELEQRRTALLVHAPIDGQIVSRGLHRLLGRRLEEGDQLALVGDERRKEIVAAVSQSDADFVTAPGDAIATAKLSGTGRTIAAQTTALDPRADVALIHPALSVEHGGPLPVVRREQTSTDGKTTSIEVEHVEPQLRLRGRLDAEAAVQVHAGRTAVLYVQTTWSGLLARQWTRLQRGVDRAWE